MTEAEQADRVGEARLAARRVADDILGGDTVTPYGLGDAAVLLIEPGDLLRRELI